MDRARFELAPASERYHEGSGPKPARSYAPLTPPAPSISRTIARSFGRGVETHASDRRADLAATLRL